MDQARLSSAEGFVLSDALIAVCIISLLALLVQSTVQSVVRSRQQLAETAERSNEEYEQALHTIGECVCEEETSDEEDNTDTSSNSY